MRTDSASKEGAGTNGPSHPGPWVQLDRLRKRFGETVVCDDISLSVPRGAFFALLGPSGCGKTSLLRLLAGLETPDEGRIVIGGEDVTALPPYERPVNMMFQSYALFPHLTVAQNVAFGLEQERRPRTEIRDRVAETLELVRLGPLARRRPDQLSGGQRQRVALARCLAKRPRLLLLDEPLAALDRKLREETRLELVKLQQQLGITFIVVTHDQDEAMSMASHLAVMDHGRIIQMGTPAEVYEFPNARRVAEFIGSVNLFEGRIIEDEPGHVVIASAEAGCNLLIGHGVSGVSGTTVWVAVRPEKIRLTPLPVPNGANNPGPDGPGQANLCRGTVRETAYLGNLTVFFITLASGKEVRASVPNLTRHAEQPLARGDAVQLSWSSGAGVVLQQ